MLIAARRREINYAHQRQRLPSRHEMTYILVEYVIIGEALNIAIEELK